MKKYDYIIWDYNGTIIDDAWVAVAAENVVLRSRGLPEIDLDFYRRECEMPIVRFYHKIYDLSKYDLKELSVAFLKNYDEISKQAKPFPEVCGAIERFSGAGLRQGVISSFDTERVRNSLKAFGLDKYFDFISGADDTSCGSKTERAALVLEKNGFDPKKTLFIGDMYHDFETAQRVGADCVIIPKGHQGEEVLRSYKNVTVLNSAEEIFN